MSSPILIALGNPGDKYKMTRHNAGVLFAMWLRDKEPELSIHTPEAYMNESGKWVGKYVNRNNIQKAVIIHDDLDIPLEKFRISETDGPKVHGGLISLEETLKTNTFWRVRIGIDNRNPANRMNGEEYVLMNFTPDEQTRLREIFPKIWAQMQIQIPILGNK